VDLDALEIHEKRAGVPGAVDREFRGSNYLTLRRMGS
jgi:hypothetical protein